MLSALNHFLLGRNHMIVSDEKSIAFQSFLSACFQSLSLVSEIWLWWSGHRFLWLILLALKLNQIWEVSNHYFFKYFFSSTLSFLFGLQCKSIRTFVFLPWVTEALSVCFQSVFSIVQIGNFLFFSSSSPIRSSVEPIQWDFYYGFGSKIYIKKKFFFIPLLKLPVFHLFWDCIILPVGIALICLLDRSFIIQGTIFLVVGITSDFGFCHGCFEYCVILYYTLFCVCSASAAATAAKLLQSCPTLCDPVDGSPQGSPVPGILQARTLEWVAIAFSSASNTGLFCPFFYLVCFFPHFWNGHSAHLSFILLF